MKKKINILLIIFISLNLITIFLSTAIVYKSFMNVVILRYGEFRAAETTHVNESTDINELKKIILKEFEYEKLWLAEKETFVNNIFASGLLLLLSTISCFTLSLILNRNIKNAIP